MGTRVNPGQNRLWLCTLPAGVALFAAALVSAPALADDNWRDSSRVDSRYIERDAWRNGGDMDWDRWQNIDDDDLDDDRSAAWDRDDLRAWERRQGTSGSYRYGFRDGAGHGYSYDGTSSGSFADTRRMHGGFVTDRGYDMNSSYEVGNNLRGRIASIERLALRNGQPKAVHLRIEGDGGWTRSVHLGEFGFARQDQMLQRGDSVRICGEVLRLRGGRVISANDVAMSNEELNCLPDRDEQIFEGRLLRISAVKAEQDQVRAVLCELESRDGRTLDVLFGSPADFRQIATTIRPGSYINASGYMRSRSDGQVFVAQDLRTGRGADEWRFSRSYTNTYPSSRTMTTATSTSTFRGEIEALKTKKVAGEDHRIATIKSESGAKQKVDLGSKDALREMVDLSKGDWVTVHGRYVFNSEVDDDEAVLEARVLEAQGLNLALNRSPRVARLDQTYTTTWRDSSFTNRYLDGSSSFDSSNLQWFSGEVLSVRRARFSGMSHDHLVATVRLNNGERREVDLGPARDINHVGLRAGDFISVHAMRGTIDANPALIASELDVNGRRMTLNQHFTSR